MISPLRWWKIKTIWLSTSLFSSIQRQIWRYYKMLKASKELNFHGKKRFCVGGTSKEFQKKWDANFKETEMKCRDLILEIWWVIFDMLLLILYIPENFEWASRLLFIYSFLCFEEILYKIMCQLLAQCYFSRIQNADIFSTPWKDNKSRMRHFLK